jgi:hypothetical protein
MMAKQLNVGDVLPEYQVQTVDGRTLHVPRDLTGQYSVPPSNCDRVKILVHGEDSTAPFLPRLGTWLQRMKARPSITQIL